MKELLNDKMLLDVASAIIIVGFLFIIYIRRNFKTEVPDTINDAIDNLGYELSDISGIKSIQREGNILQVYFEYLPGESSLSRIPVIYKGYLVETFIFNEGDEQFKIK